MTKNVQMSNSFYHSLHIKSKLKFQHLSKAGFTLIEILLIVALIIALFGLSTGFYSRFINQNAVSDTIDQLTNQLRKAQYYSMIGKSDGTNNVWGVRFTTSPRRITLFLQGGTLQEHFPVNNNINVVFDPITPAEITFAHVTGVPSSTPTIIISNPSSNTYKSISVNTQGLTERIDPVLPPPTLTTQAASSVTDTSATLNGLANPNGYASTGYFRYDTLDPGTCSDSFGTRAPLSGGTALGAGSTNVAYSENISGLSASTTYYYCAIATNVGGVGLGAVSFFTTSAPPVTPPTVTTQAASAITNNSAALNGSADPNGDATTGYFRYDTSNPGTCNDTFGTRAPSSGGTNLGSGTTVVNYLENISGLSASTTYYYCAIATNSGGNGYGDVVPFTTDAPPPTNIEFVASVSNTGNNTTSNSFSLPAGWSAGNVAVFWWYTFANTKTITPSASITQKQQASSAGFGRLFIGYRVLQSGDTTFAWTASSVTNSTVIWGTSVFRNVNTTSDPFEAQSGAPVTFSNTSSPNPPAVTTISPDAMVVPIFGKNNDYSSITPPALYTSAGSNTSTAGSDSSAGAAYLFKTSAGLADPGVFSAAGANSDDGYVWTGVLKPD